MRAFGYFSFLLVNVLMSTSQSATMFSLAQWSVSLEPLPPAPTTPMLSFSFAESLRGAAVAQPVRAAAPTRAEV